MGLSVSRNIQSIFISEMTRSSETVNGRKLSFSMANIYDDLVENNNEFEDICLNLSGFLNSKYVKKTLQGLIRFAFLCQPVNDEITTTTINLRWIMAEDDSRYSSFDNCIQVFNHTLGCINNFLNNVSSENLEYYSLYLDNPSCPYDIPFDYVSIEVEKIHRVENIIFYSPSDFIKILKARIAYKKILNDIIPKKILGKIDVCSYKTERSQTGDFKTNREYRWETVRCSPQGASKKFCWEIEVKLMNQICEMKNFPDNVKLPDNINEIERNTTLCPVMLEKLDYNDLLEDGNNTTHGESTMQLGHLEPKSNSLGAHNKNNISWISKEGNRIQGNNSIDEIHEKIISLSKRITEQRKG